MINKRVHYWQAALYLPTNIQPVKHYIKVNVFKRLFICKVIKKRFHMRYLYTSSPWFLWYDGSCSKNG